MSLEINNEIIEDEIINNEFQLALKYFQASSTNYKQEEILQTVKESIIYKTLLKQAADSLDETIPQASIDKEYQIFFENKKEIHTPEEKKKIHNYIITKFKESIFIDKLCQDLGDPQEIHLRQFFKDNQKDYFISKQYHLMELGVMLTQGKPDFPQMNRITQVREKLLQSHFQPKGINDFKTQFPEEFQLFQKSGYLKTWEIAENQLLDLGKKFFYTLEPLQYSKVIENAVDAFFFTPINKNNLPNSSMKKTLSFFYLQKLLTNHLPSFNEVKQQVYLDLIEEMRQIKVKSYLRKKMEESDIKDINYI